MKVRLNYSFDLDNEEDTYNYKQHKASLDHWGDVCSLIHEFESKLRSMTKYAPENTPEETLKAYEEIRKIWFELKSDSDLDGVEI